MSAALTNAVVDDNAVLWRYLRLRHAVGSHCFGWRFEGELIAFGYELPEHCHRQSFTGGDA